MRPKTYLLKHRIYGFIVAETGRTGRAVSSQKIIHALGLSEVTFCYNIKPLRDAGLVDTLSGKAFGDHGSRKYYTARTIDPEMIPPPEAKAPDWLDEDDWTPKRLMSDAEISKAFGGSP